MARVQSQVQPVSGSVHAVPAVFTQAALLPQPHNVPSPAAGNLHAILLMQMEASFAVSAVTVGAYSVVSVKSFGLHEQTAPIQKSAWPHTVAASVAVQAAPSLRQAVAPGHQRHEHDSPSTPTLVAAGQAYALSLLAVSLTPMDT